MQVFVNQCEILTIFTIGIQDFSVGLTIAEADFIESTESSVLNSTRFPRLSVFYTGRSELVKPGKPMTNNRRATDEQQARFVSAIKLIHHD